RRTHQAFHRARAGARLLPQTVEALRGRGPVGGSAARRRVRSGMRSMPYEKGVGHAVRREFREHPMFIFEKAPFESCHASTIVELEPGKFLAAWFGGKGEGKPDVKVWWSRFDGRKWSPPEAAAEEPGSPCWNPVLFKSRKGTFFLFW